jgi:hypothetical protein
VRLHKLDGELTCITEFTNSTRTAASGGGHDAHCSTDAEAFAEIAHTVGIFSAAELWCGTRRVGRWEPRKVGVAASDWDGRHSLESTTFRTGRLLTPSAPGQLGPTRQTAAPVMAHAGEDLTERPAATQRAPHW